MSYRIIKKAFAITVLTAILPCIVIELMIKDPDNLIARVRLNFQFMIFIIDLGNQK